MINFNISQFIPVKSYLANESNKFLATEKIEGNNFKWIREIAKFVPSNISPFELECEQLNWKLSIKSFRSESCEINCVKIRNKPSHAVHIFSSSHQAHRAHWKTKSDHNNLMEYLHCLMIVHELHCIFQTCQMYCEWQKLAAYQWCDKPSKMEKNVNSRTRTIG